MSNYVAKECEGNATEARMASSRGSATNLGTGRLICAVRKAGPRSSDRFFSEMKKGRDLAYPSEGGPPSALTLRHALDWPVRQGNKELNIFL